MSSATIFHRARKPPVSFKLRPAGLVVIYDGGLHACLSRSDTLQSGVNLPRTAAFGSIAGNVKKIRFLVAAGAFFRWLGCSDGVPAIAATPICQMALRADIPLKLP
jgi:hypothetical protein